MEVGIFTRSGKHLLGRIGVLDLAWDRTAGGRLRVAYHAPAGPVPVGVFTLHATLEETSVTTASDADPRLIPVETGPHRLALRAVQQLADTSGQHLGDAMQETWAWAGGDLYLNGMLRLIDPEHGGRLIDAFAEFRFPADWRPISEEAHDITCLVHETGLHLAVARYGNGSAWAVPIEDGDPWERLDGQPPYYRRWGPYYDQWGGEAGWSRCVLDNDPEGPVLRAFWAQGDARERSVIDAFRGTLALLFAQDADTLARKLTAFKSPLAPAVEGGRALYHSPMDGTTVVRKTGESLKLIFPPDPVERTARVCICGASDRRVLRASAEDNAIVLPLTDGGVTDDPNGPDLLRPDDRHGPILTDERVRPDDALVVLQLAKDRETHTELTPTSGLQLACQKWDDRQNLLLFSSAHPQGNLFALSLRDLKIRGIGIPGFPNGVMIWEGPQSDAYHQIFSCTKTFTTTVLGLLIGDGLCALEDRAADYHPSLADVHPWHRDITFRHLATMTSGYDGETGPENPELPWGDPNFYTRKPTTLASV